MSIQRQDKFYALCELEELLNTFIKEWRQGASNKSDFITEWDKKFKIMPELLAILKN